MGATGRSAQPLAGYAPDRRAGDLACPAGLVIFKPETGTVVEGYADLPGEGRVKAGYTGQIPVDSKEGWIAAQTRHMVSRRREPAADLGGFLENPLDVSRCFRDLPDLAVCGRRPASFSSTLPAGTVFPAAESLPTPAGRREVQAVACIPE